MKRTGLTFGLAVVGMVLTWLAPGAGVLLPAIGFGDNSLTALWYVPAALFPLVLIGGAMLLWAAFRAKFRKRLVGLGFSAAVGFWVAAVVLSLVTGLSSGAVAEGGWQSALVTACFAGYTLASVHLGGAGIALLRDLSASAQTARPGEPEEPSDVIQPPS